jgi:dimethylglycine dehydrogenase
MNSRGMQFSGGIGKEMSNLIVDGTTSVDMFGYDLARFPNAKHLSDPDWVHQTTHESEVRSYWIGYPTRQRFAGRNVRKSPLWEDCLRAGAFFGQCGGQWEVPKFYLPDYKQELQLQDYDWLVGLSHTID